MMPITVLPITNVVLIFSWLLSNCAVSVCPSVLCVLVWKDLVIDGPWTVYVCFGGTFFALTSLFNPISCASVAMTISLL